MSPCAVHVLSIIAETSLHHAIDSLAVRVRRQARPCRLQCCYELVTLVSLGEGAWRHNIGKVYSGL